MNKQQISQRSKNRQEIEGLVAALTSFMSHQRDVQEDFVKELVSQHRTDQQSVMRLFMLFVDKLAEQKTDMRNEAAVELAQKIKVRLLGEAHLPYI